MASHGKVLDLTDDRHLNLQDVFGNVELLPTLVPYDEYSQNVLVYRMDSNHEMFMTLIQDFTDREARDRGRELWSWCVQWHVEEQTTDRLDTFAHSPKRPRLDSDFSKAQLTEPQPKRRAPTYDIIQRRIIDPEVMKEEEMMRILMDIIQVESSVVPNFIEFLYRWIDFYEGDGKALEAALHHEIPSLWDFEYHPLTMSADQKRQADQERATKAEAGDASMDGDKDEVGNKMPKNRTAEELIQGSPTKKMREKPDLAAMVRKTEDSDRLQYREVKFGIQPPKLNEPLPPMVNVPRDQRKRNQYYAACFKSRQRALNLLVEAGISVQQISHYKKGQKEHPKDTPLEGEGGGLRHYHKDAHYAQHRYVEKEKEMALREKNMEIAISNKLAAEALLAARSAKPGDSSGVPLIPPTPPYERRPNMAAAMLSKTHAANGIDEDRINVVPKALVSSMKSSLFEEAKDKQAWLTLGRPRRKRQDGFTFPLLHTQAIIDSESDHEEEYDADSENDFHAPRDANIYRSALNIAPPRTNASFVPSLGNRPQPSLPIPPPPSQSLAASGRPGEASNTGNSPSSPQQGDASTVGAAGSDTPGPLQMTEYMRNLTPERARHVLPLLENEVRQRIGNNFSAQFEELISESHASVPPTGGGPVYHATAAVPSTTSSQGETHSRTSLPPPPPTQATATRQVPRSSLPALPPLPPLPPLPSTAASTATAAGTAEDQGPRLMPQSMPSASRPSAITISPPQASRSGQIPHPEGSERAPASVRSAPDMQTNPGQESPQPPRLPRFPTAPGLSGPPEPPAWAQRLAAFQRSQEAARRDEVQHDAASSTPRNPASSFASNGSFSEFLAQRLQQGGVVLAQTPVQSPRIQVPIQTLGSPSSASIAPQPSQVVHSPQPVSTSTGTNTQTPRPSQLQGPQPSLLPPGFTTLGSGFTPPTPNIQRNVPSPLNLMTPSPLSALSSSILATSPFQVSNPGTPIQIYFPKIVVPGNTIGPGGAKLGDGGIPETDALLLGYTKPGSGKIVLSRAIFLPVGVWTNTLRRVRRGAWKVLETYPVPRTHPKFAVGNPIGPLGMPVDVPRASRDSLEPHQIAYTKLAQAYGLMSCSKDREEDLTKRWRVTKGLMTRTDRGAVWEGYGGVLDRGIEMSAHERKGALLSSVLIDEGVDKKEKGLFESYEERQRRLKEIDELMDEDEEDEDAFAGL